MSTVTSGSARRAAMPILLALSASHFLNDLIQSLIPAIYPIIKTAYALDFAQIGFITLTFQVMASLLQPLVGHVTDRNPMPYSMVVGMGFSLVGLLGLAFAGSYPLLLAAAACVGIGSSIFHPEATRIARTASGGQHGLAQGIFQVGGMSGSAIGPVLAAFIIVPNGQGSLAWFALAALIAMALMTWTATAHARLHTVIRRKPGEGAGMPAAVLPMSTVIVALLILIVLLFSKNAYSQSFSSFYTFYLIDRFGLSIQASQIMLFLFLASAAVGVVFGGILGDHIGRRKVILFSIFGALPFALILPYADLFWTGVLTVIINIIMSSAFAAIMIYAMELLPGRVGMIGGLFYGLAFGLGGLAAAILGTIADVAGIEMVYRICSFLPLVGIMALLLPKLPDASAAADTSPA